MIDTRNVKLLTELKRSMEPVIGSTVNMEVAGIVHDYNIEERKIVIRRGGKFFTVDELRLVR